MAAGGEAVDAGERSIDRQDRRIERNKSLTLQPSLLAGLALIVLSGRFRTRGRTLIEIWDTGGSMKRLAAFPIRGSAGYRIGWSQDAHRFAAIRSTGDGTDALIYAIP